MGATSHTITATQLRSRIGCVLDAAELRGERVVVTRRGKPAAAVVPMADLELLDAYEDALLSEEADEAADDPENQGRIPWKQVKAESRGLAEEDRADAEDIERVLADPNEEWTPLEGVLAEMERLP
ncbi:MAG: type II toxin-antitoxin system Phd/YefM family antitoxin [Armatimonadetes bacterium]|nr:type II toxin-antitoxin system Phd/YefM family antitoxin [Armatimonadota bacterium]